MNAYYQVQQEKTKNLYTHHRLMGISFNSISLEVETNENATPDEIKAQAIEHILNNFWEFVEGKIECDIMPKDTLNEKTSFIGQLVIVRETNMRGVILKINKQNHKSVTVLFPDETTNIYYFNDLKRSYESVESISLPTVELKEGEKIKPHVIYRVDTGITRELAIITFNRSLESDRVGVNYITNSAQRKVRFMPYDNALNIIRNI